MIFTQLLFGQPHFPIARFILRPLFGYLGRTGFYNVLWSFAGSTISNVGILQGLIILIGIRRYIYGTISISTLSDLIFNRNAILGTIFNTVVRTELISYARRNLVNQFAPRRLINFIIVNTFVYLFNSIIKFVFKLIFYFGFTLVSLLFIMSFENVKYITKFAYIIKNVVLYYLRIDIPISYFINETNINDKSWFNKLTYGYSKIINFFSFYKNNNNNVNYVRKFNSHTEVDNVYTRNKKYDKFKEELVKNNNNNNFNNNNKNNHDFDININNIVSDNLNIVTNNFVSGVCSDDYYVNFLINLFNEFNLFI